MKVSFVVFDDMGKTDLAIKSVNYIGTSFASPGWD
jgi:hypothetical protein